ncbi:MAG: hypothetical protein BGO41_09050 [Clostridiales bacterium 38-18]|nr:MAG: hypothetical protein BGO41_09050 [Clostridiales bacterium 38-18]
MPKQVMRIRIIDGQPVEQAQDVSFTASPIYEVIRLFEGVPLFIESHLKRLYNSMQLTGLILDLTMEQVVKAIQLLIELTHMSNTNVRLEIGKVSKDQLCWTLYLVESVYPESAVYETGVETTTYKIERPNPHAKVYRASFTELISVEKIKNNVFEVILVNENGLITEGSRSNLFFIKGNTLFSAKRELVLEGITREKVLEVLAEQDINLIEEDLPSESLHSYEACFLTGTSIHILPISRIDSTYFDSANHPVIIALQNAFKTKIQNDLQQTRRLYK